MLLIADKKIDDYVTLRYWPVYILGWKERKCFPEISL